MNSRKNTPDEKIYFHHIINKLKNEPTKNPHSNWLVSFYEKEYKELNNKRNPYVHYKIKTDKQSENKNEIDGDGSLIPTVLNKWHNATFDDMQKLESENKQLKEFLLIQFRLCKTGYEHMIELIKLLPEKEY